MLDEKEIEVYQYVKEHSTKYLSTIIKGMQDGLKEENSKMKEQKNKIEAGILTLLMGVKLSKMPERYKSVLLEALKSGTFFNFNSSIKELEENSQEHIQVCDCEVQPCYLHEKIGEV